MLRISNCLDYRLTDGGKVVSPTHRPQFTPQKRYYFYVCGTDNKIKTWKKKTQMGRNRYRWESTLRWIVSMSSVEPTHDKVKLACWNFWSIMRFSISQNSFAPWSWFVRFPAIFITGTFDLIFSYLKNIFYFTFKIIGMVVIHHLINARQLVKWGIWSHITFIDNMKAPAWPPQVPGRR
jgi:hypothetical protein